MRVFRRSTSILILARLCKFRRPTEILKVWRYCRRRNSTRLIAIIITNLAIFNPLSSKSYQPGGGKKISRRGSRFLINSINSEAQTSWPFFLNLYIFFLHVKFYKNFLVKRRKTEMKNLKDPTWWTENIENRSTKLKMGILGNLLKRYLRICQFKIQKFKIKL